MNCPLLHLVQALWDLSLPRFHITPCFACQPLLMLFSERSGFPICLEIPSFKPSTMQHAPPSLGRDDVGRALALLEQNDR